MRLKAFALAATAFLAGCVQAQSASAPTESANQTAAAAGAAAMKMALQMFPKCAVSQLLNYLRLFTCGLY